MFTYSKGEHKQQSKNMIQKKTTEKSSAASASTGIPEAMKMQLEHMSGFSFDDVHVQYNSDKPRQLQALAYTQGNQVYIGPGQEKHLGHELGHVIQQKQGRVQPTMQLQGANVNDNENLEKEADMLGNQAIQYKKPNNFQQLKIMQYSSSPQMTVQRVIQTNESIGLTGEFIERAKNVSAAVREVIEGWESRKDLITFVNLDDFVNHVMAERTHDTVSDLLGIPINPEAGNLIHLEDTLGKAAALKLLNKIEEKRNLTESEDTSDGRIRFMIHRAAAGVVTGVGVCDNFASLSALIMRAIGLERVTLHTGLGHKFASVGGILVDPWYHLTHKGFQAETLSWDDNIDQLSPTELKTAFDEEITICKDLLDASLMDLEPHEREAFVTLINKRQDSGLGKINWRKSQQSNLDKKSASIQDEKRKHDARLRRLSS